MTDRPGTDLITAEGERQQAMQLMLDLERAGAIDEVSLTLTDPALPYEQWESLGRLLGSFDRRSRWYVGDWLIAGEALYGEESAQAVEDTTASRYDKAERVTGLDHGTLMNIRSICAKVPKDRRRSELGFWMHAEVTALEPAEQEQWLQAAIDDAMNRAALRAAIRASKQGDDPPDEPSFEGNPAGDGLTGAERLERAARLVFHQGQRASDGSVLVPGEAWAQLVAALGEE